MFSLIALIAAHSIAAVVIPLLFFYYPILAKKWTIEQSWKACVMNSNNTVCLWYCFLFLLQVLDFRKNTRWCSFGASVLIIMLLVERNFKIETNPRLDYGNIFFNICSGGPLKYKAWLFYEYCQVILHDTHKYISMIQTHVNRESNTKS